MREQEMKKILQALDHQPLPSKEKVLAACEDAFEDKETKKASQTAPVLLRCMTIKNKMIRVGALAACLCLLVTGIFGGVGLLKNQFGDATAPITQAPSDLPFENYPSNEIDYANMSMVEYMELFPDFLSYRYMPWKEGYAFAHLEILEVESGYRYQYDEKSYYDSTVVKCRVISDAWNVLEEGSELNFFINGNGEFFNTVSSVLLRFPVKESFPCVNIAGEKVTAILFDVDLEYLGCFPIEDGKVQLKKLETYLNFHNKKLNYEGNSLISDDPNYVYCTFDDVASIVAEGMETETAVENLRNVYAKYQTGEYNSFNISLMSRMTYGEYCRMLEGTLTKEDFDRLGKTELGLAYSTLPGLVTREFSLSDGTVFELCTRIEIPDSYLPELLAEFDRLEKMYTDENGVMNTKKVLEAIDSAIWSYNFKAILHTFG